LFSPALAPASIPPEQHPADNQPIEDTREARRLLARKTASLCGNR
jgi:hypothetical protein